MHGLIRKNASFLNHITFRYIYIYTHTHSRVENTLIILSQEVSLNYHNFFPSHPSLFLITDQPTDSIPFRSIPRLPLISRIKRSIPRIDSPPPPPPPLSTCVGVSFSRLDFLSFRLSRRRKLNVHDRYSHLITSPRCDLCASLFCGARKNWMNNGRERPGRGWSIVTILGHSTRGDIA